MLTLKIAVNAVVAMTDDFRAVNGGVTADFTLAGSTVIDEGGIVWNMTTISGSPELGIFLIGRYNLTA